MRTVTFSDEKIAKLVNENFVSTWINRNPKFHNCDLAQEQRIFTQAYESYATKNFCTFFVTPDLDVLHYFSGYYSPEFFRHEVEFVQELAEKACDRTLRLKKDGLAAYRLLHAQHARKHADDAGVVRAIKPPSNADRAAYAEYKKNAEGWRQRRESLLESLTYLDRVHENLQKHTIKKARPYTLAEVIRNYQGGNEFTEE
jgi:uncharacterized protein YyaL (SSP411 family)